MRSRPLARSPEELARVARAVQPPDLAAVASSLMGSRPVARTACLSLHAQSSPLASCLLLTVPKRVLIRAVDRNVVRRIARESWRAAGAASRGQAVLLRLRKRPERFAEMPSGERKRFWRLEIDRLFGRLDGGA